MEIIYFLIIFFSFSKLNQFAKVTFENLTKGQTPEQFQKSLLAMGPEKMQDVLLSMKTDFTLVFISLLLLIILTIFSFTILQSRIWNFIEHKKFSFKKYWRWNALIFTLPFLLAVFFVIYAIIKIIVLYLLNFILRNPDVNFVFVYTLNVIFFISILIFMLIVFDTFVKKYQVFSSIGDTFKIIRIKWSRLWKMNLLVTLTIVILGFIFKNLQAKLVLLSSTTTIIIQTLIFLLVVAWVRFYLLKVIK